MRKNAKFRTIDWDGPKASEGLFKGMETKPLNLEDGVIEEPEEKKEHEVVDDERKVIGEEPKEIDGFHRNRPAPFLYSAMFNNK